MTFDGVIGLVTVETGWRESIPCAASALPPARPKGLEL
jgi:hypothetical protein